MVSGKYDAAITNVTVTKERKTRFDFATYRIDSLGFYVKTGGKIATIKQPADIAGLKIIVGSGTNQEAILLAWDKQNRQQGLKPFQPIYVTDDAAATLAIQSGRADAYFGPNVLGAYKAALNGRTRLAGTVEGGWPKAAHIAVTTRKGNGLVQAVNEALNGAIGGGQYDRVLNRWGERRTPCAVGNQPARPGRLGARDDARHLHSDAADRPADRPGNRGAVRRISPALRRLFW